MDNTNLRTSYEERTYEFNVDFRSSSLTIRIEGTNKYYGKHAAGVIVSRHRLKDVCPMISDKSGVPVAAFEMGDLETLGLVKLDILGIDLLSKVMEIKENDDD